MLQEIIHSTKMYERTGRQFPSDLSLLIGMNSGVPPRDIQIMVRGERVIWKAGTGEVVTAPAALKPEMQP